MFTLHLIAQLKLERNCLITGVERSDEFIANAFCTLLVASLLAVTCQNYIATIGALVFTLKLIAQLNLERNCLIPSSSLLTISHLTPDDLNRRHGGVDLSERTRGHSEAFGVG